MNKKDWEFRISDLIAFPLDMIGGVDEVAYDIKEILDLIKQLIQEAEERGRREGRREMFEMFKDLSKLKEDKDE